jgi:hypothetical protein
MGMTTSAWLGSGLVLAALVPVGCATPTPVVRLSPMTPGAVWVAGRSVEAQQRQGVRVAAAFDHQDGEAIVFRVEVANDGSKTVDVGPDAMTFNTRAHNGWSAEALVADPEEMLANLDAAHGREVANAENDARLLTPLIFLSAVGDVASVASGQVDRGTGLRTTALSDQLDGSQLRHATRAQEIGAEKAMWLDVALRRTTLAPGQSAAGRVYIPLRPEAHFVRLNVWADDLAFTFVFRQTVTPAS